jgi:glycosyltransferase involved in cell wall biosynthesis
MKSSSIPLQAKPQPRISVFITSYNQKAYLREAIDSVLAQTLSPYEIIVVDDASTDGSQDLIQDYASQHPDLIKTIFHQTNTGVTQSRVDALEAVTGDYVTYVDGDDRFLPTKLEKEYAALRQAPEARIAFSNNYYMTAEGIRTGMWIEDDKPPQGKVFVQTFGRLYPKRSLYRMELVEYAAWKKIGFHDLNLGIYEDFDMRIRMTKRLQTVYCDESLSEIRCHDKGLSNSRGCIHQKSLDFIFQKNRGLLMDLETVARRNAEQGFLNWRQIATDIALKEIKSQRANHDDTAGFSSPVSTNQISHVPLTLEADYRGRDLIFLISQPRAGSTLLQRLIAGHEEIHATAEPWLMLHPLYALKNSGMHTEYRSSLARTALQDFLAQFPDGESVYTQSLRRQAACLYQSALKLSGKRYFLDKTPRYYHIIPELYRVFPDAKFVLLFRNPLAVFSSTLKTWLNNDPGQIDPATRLDLYDAPQKLIDGARVLKDSAIIVNYEQLVRQPLAELRRLFVRLGLVFQDDLLEYGSRVAPVGRLGDPENVDRHARPVTEYVNKWITNLKEPNLAKAAEDLLAHIGEDTIIQMGYSFTELQQTIGKLKNGIFPDQPISKNANELQKDGKQLLAANKIKEAATIYMKLIEEDPRNPEALLGMAHVSLASGRPADALDFCAQVKKIAPQNRMVESMRAKIDQMAFRSSDPSEKNLRARIGDNDGQAILAETEQRPRVSAIVSTYNSQRFIKGRLQNLIDQSLFRKGQLEIIVIDSNSSENEGAIVNSFRKTHPQIKYIRTPVRETIYGAWNRGLNASSGTYFVNANADDRFAVDALETMADALDRESQYDAVYGNWLVTQTPNDTFESQAPKRLFIYPDFHPGLFFYLQITSHANFIRRNIFEKIGPFDDTYTVGGDREFMLRFAVNGRRALKLEKIVGLYLENPQSLERSNKEIGMNECVSLFSHYLEPACFARLMKIGSDTSPTALSDAYTEVGCFGIKLYQIDDQYGHTFGSPTRLFAKAIELNPSNVAALNNMGVVAHHRQAKDEAIRFFESASKLASNEQQDIIDHNLNQIMQYAAGSGKLLHFIYPQGYQPFYVIDIAFDSISSLSPDLSRRRRSLLRAKTNKNKRKSTKKRQCQPSPGNQPRASGNRKVFHQAQRYYLRDDFQSALKVLSNIIMANSDQWEVYHLYLDLVPLYYDSSAIPKELKPLENRLDLPPDVLASIGMAYDAAGQLNQAMRFAQKAFALDDNCARAWNLQGIITFRQGNWAIAADHFKKAVRCDASWGDPWTNLGTLHWEQNNKSKAMDCFEKGLALSPTSPHVADAYYGAILDTQKIARALPILKKIGNTHPHFKKIHLLYIDALIKDEAYQSALIVIKNFVGQFGTHRELLEVERSIRQKLNLPIDRAKKDQTEDSQLAIVPNTVNDTSNPRDAVSLIIINGSDQDLPHDNLSTWLKIDHNLVRDIIVLEPRITDHLSPDTHESLGSLKRFYINLNRSFGSQINAIIATLSTDTIAFIRDDLSFFDGWLEYLLQNRKFIDRPGVSGPMGSFAKSPIQRWDNSVDSDELNILGEPFCHRLIPASTIEPFCFIVDRNAYLKMGGFQDGYHTLQMGLQDLCYRYKLAGYRNFISGGIVFTSIGKQEPSPIWSNQEMLVLDQKHFTKIFEAIGSGAPSNAQALSAIWLEKSCGQHLQGRWQDAWRSLQKALAIQPDNWKAYHHMTDLLLSVEPSADIPEQIQLILTHKDIPAATLATLGNLFAYSGDIATAAELAEASTKKSPDNAFALNLSGYLAFVRRDFQTATAFFDHAAQRSPHWGDPWTNMGMIHWELGNLEQALECFEKGFVLSPTAPHVAANYHAALCQTEALSRGSSLFQEVLRRYPHFNTGIHLLIDIFLKMGRTQSAMDHIEALLVQNTLVPGLLDAALAVREKLGPTEIKADQTPTLSLCMIVKNEEAYLAQCLASLRPVVDEMIVVDTGSKDQTRSIAAAFGARVFGFDWIDDFAAARNYSLAQARGDWILVMDADEIISTKDHGRLRELIKTSKSRKVAFSMVTRNYMNRNNTDGWIANDGVYGEEEKSTGWVPSQKVRLFPNDSQIRFEYPVHEIVDHALKRAGSSVRPISIPIHHYGKLNRQHAQSKGETYYRIGLKKLEKTGDLPKALSELAIQAAELDHFEEAITLWRRFLEKKPSSSKAWANLAALYVKTKQYGESNQAARKAVDFDPDRKEGHLNLGISELYLGNANLAAEILSSLIKRNPDYLPAIFFCGAAQICASEVSLGLNTFRELKHYPTWQYNAYAFSDLAKGLHRAGHPLYAHRLLAVAEDLNPGDETLLHLKTSLEAGQINIDRDHRTHQEAVCN